MGRLDWRMAPGAYVGNLFAQYDTVSLQHYSGMTNASAEIGMEPIVEYGSAIERWIGHVPYSLDALMLNALVVGREAFIATVIGGAISYALLGGFSKDRSGQGR